MELVPDEIEVIGNRLGLEVVLTTGCVTVLHVFTVVAVVVVVTVTVVVTVLLAMVVTKLLGTDVVVHAIIILWL